MDDDMPISDMPSLDSAENSGELPAIDDELPQLEEELPATEEGQ